MCTFRTRYQVNCLSVSSLKLKNTQLLGGMKTTLNELGSECCFSKKGTWRTELNSENQPTSWSSTPPDPTRQSTAVRWPPSTIKGTLMRYLLVLQWEVRSAELHQGRESGGHIYIHLLLGKVKFITGIRTPKLKAAPTYEMKAVQLKQAVQAAHHHSAYVPL